MGSALIWWLSSQSASGVRVNIYPHTCVCDIWLDRHLWAEISVRVRRWNSCQSMISLFWEQRPSLMAMDMSVRLISIFVVIHSVSSTCESDSSICLLNPFWNEVEISSTAKDHAIRVPGAAECRGQDNDKLPGYWVSAFQIQMAEEWLWSTTRQSHDQYNGWIFHNPNQIGDLISFGELHVSGRKCDRQRPIYCCSQRQVWVKYPQVF